MTKIIHKKGLKTTKNKGDKGRRLRPTQARAFLKPSSSLLCPLPLKNIFSPLFFFIIVA